MSMPMTAKSPLASSQISGQPRQAGVCAPLAWGSGADSAQKHDLLLTIVRCLVKTFFTYFRFVASDKKSQQAVCSRVAHILRKEREKRGISMNLAAERAGLSQQMVSYVEREMRNPTLETLLRMAAAIQVDLSKVLKQAQNAGKEG